MFWHYSERKKFVFEIRRICFFFSLFSFLLYVTFFFSFISCFLICLKILYFIPFRVYYILLKQKSKQNPSKMQSKHLSKTANIVAQDCWCYFPLYPYRVYISSFSFCFNFCLSKISSKMQAKYKAKRKQSVKQNKLIPF